MRIKRVHLYKRFEQYWAPKALLLMTFWLLLSELAQALGTLLILMLVENSQYCSWLGLGQAKTGTHGLLVIFLYCLIYPCADHTVKTPQTFSFPAPLLNHVCCLVIYWHIFSLKHRGPVIYKVAPPTSKSEVNNSNNINLRECTVWLRLCGYFLMCHLLLAICWEQSLVITWPAFYSFFVAPQVK